MTTANRRSYATAFYSLESGHDSIMLLNAAKIPVALLAPISRVADARGVSAMGRS